MVSTSPTLSRATGRKIVTLSSRENSDPLATQRPNFYVTTTSWCEAKMPP